MSHHTENSIKVNIPAEKVWGVLANYSGIENFAATIESSPIVGNIKSGLGAKRKNTFSDGSSLVEEITDYQEGQGYKMEVSEHTLPLKEMQAQMWVKKIDSNSSEIFMAADFVVKGGPLGWIMGQFIMRPVMKGVFKKVMSGLAYHCATDKRVDEKAPTNEELAKIVIS